jgi:hypothetical protein
MNTVQRGLSFSLPFFACIVSPHCRFPKKFFFFSFKAKALENYRQTGFVHGKYSLEMVGGEGASQKNQNSRYSGSVQLHPLSFT